MKQHSTGVLWENLFRNISLNSQESTYDGRPFLVKLLVSGYSFTKNDSNYMVSVATVILNCNGKLIVNTAQSAFICSKLTIETLEQGVKYVQS